MTFPSNVDNLCILMMDTLDQNKLQLQTKIKEVLDRADGGKYHPGRKRKLFLLQ